MRRSPDRVHSFEPSETNLWDGCDCRDMGLRPRILCRARRRRPAGYWTVLDDFSSACPRRAWNSRAMNLLRATFST